MAKGAKEMKVIKLVMRDEDTNDMVMMLAVPSKGEACLVLHEESTNEQAAVVLDVEAAEELIEALSAFVEASDG
jgi:hypothetical protein